jgi:AcrR family transcriptional regulator
MGTPAGPVAAAAAERGGPARDRLLVAARELLTEVPLDAITVRAIAARAGVGHSLITRYYGSRAGLLAAAIADALTTIADEIACADDIHAAVRLAFARVQENPELTSAINVTTTQTDTLQQRRGFPVVEAFTAHLQAAGVPAEHARERAATITMMVFIWAGSGTRWLKMSGYDHDPTTGRYRYLQMLLELVDHSTPPS